MRKQNIRLIRLNGERHDRSWMEGRAMGSVLSIGVDVVEVDRIARAASRKKFLDRCFTESEKRYAGVSQEAHRRLAARFSAKEAAFKALDLSGGIGRFLEVEVIRRPSGAVDLSFTGRALDRFKAMGGESAHLSFTHGRDIAIAVVVIEG